jgi:hypothetical protein
MKITKVSDELHKNQIKNEEASKNFESILKERDLNIYEINNFKNNSNKQMDGKDVIMSNLTNHSYNME